MRLLVALAVWVGAVAGAVAVSHVVAQSIHAARATASAPSRLGADTGGGSAGAVGGPAASGAAAASGARALPTPPRSPDTIRATDRESLFRPANLARTLALVRRRLGPRGRIVQAALYPGYAGIIAARRGAEAELYVDAYGHSDETSTGAPLTGDALIPLAAVDPGAPAALARRIATAAHVPPSRLAYMVLRVDPVSSQRRWLVYTRPGTGVEYFEAAGASGPLLELLAGGQQGLRAVGG